jgi:hypothetical protein
MVARRADIYWVQSSSLRTGVKEIVTLLGKSWWAIFHAIVGSVGSAMSSRALAVAGQRQDRRSGRFDVTTRVHVARHAGDYT